MLLLPDDIIITGNSCCSSSSKSCSCSSCSLVLPSSTSHKLCSQARTKSSYFPSGLSTEILFSLIWSRFHPLLPAQSCNSFACKGAMQKFDLNLITKQQLSCLQVLPVCTFSKKYLIPSIPFKDKGRPFVQEWWSSWMNTSYSAH